ncbi:hypothetical protein AB0H58_32490 [Nocardia neocaledoniensis]|uniref:hypothetical protein n=1 Tax=Nocardia neocaledoniensis TaxID=236511 RepID=UPI00340F1074
MTSPAHRGTSISSALASGNTLAAKTVASAAGEGKLLTWTLKMPPSQAEDWDDIVAAVAAEIGRPKSGRSKLTRKEVVESLMDLLRDDATVRAAIVKHLAA